MSVAQQAHLNMLAFIELTSELMDGAEVERSDGDFLAFANHPFVFLNVAATIAGTDDPAGFLDRAGTFFGAREVGYVVYTRDGFDGERDLAERCKERGFAEYPHYPEMIVHGRIDEPPLPEGCELAPVTTSADARAYWDLCNAAYPSIGFPPGSFDSFPDELASDSRVRAWIARVDGEPAACALGYVAEGCTFVGWVATVEKARGRGLGALCTARVVNDCDAPLAALQASPMGESVYRRLGFEEAYNYRLWIRPSA